MMIGMDRKELTGRDLLRLAIDDSLLTDGEAADKLKIPRSYLSEILNRRRVPNADEIAKFQKHYRIAPESWGTK